MEKVRVILQSSPSGENERMDITTDFEVDANDYICPGNSIDSDTIIEMDLDAIPGFPLEHSFKVD